VAHKDIFRDTLFPLHLQALLKKRFTYFRRDRKAWLCTTIIPSLFVLIGFIVFAFAGPNRNLDPLTLDLGDYISDTKPEAENFIAFNSQGNPFLCQPGFCSHREPYVNSELTNEKYVFCGYEAKLGISSEGYLPSNRTCTISASAESIGRINIDGAKPVEAQVQNISEVR
jgi:hypothetical protein